MANRMISYGYGYNDGVISIIDSEAKIVKRIFREYIEGILAQEIAERLSKEEVEFYMGDTVWNKNKVFRIIENEKYIGQEEYPAIIQLEVFQQANEKRTNRGNKKIVLSDEVEYLKKITYCAQCGKLFHRRTKWKKREKWYCVNGCKNDKYIADKEVFEGILSVISFIMEEPSCLIPVNGGKTYQPTQEIMRYTNEIVRMTNQPLPCFTTGKKVILECAALKFQECKENTEVYTNNILEKIRQVWEKGKIDIDFLSETVSQIKIFKDGKIAVKFFNGVEVISK